MEYKIELSEGEKLEMDSASRLYKLGNLEEALPILEKLSLSHSTSPMLVATLANLHWDLKNIDKAIELFNTAVKLGPKSEKISRGLFHILWEKSDEINAVAEIQRFIDTGCASAEYINMASEINLKKGLNIKIP